MARWSLWVFLPLALFSATHSCGVRRPGLLIGVRDGAIVYEDANLPARTKQPPRPFEFYTRDYYAGGDLAVWTFVSKGTRWKQVIVPLWMPLLVVVGCSFLAPRRRPTRTPGPHRLTWKRYLCGMIRYLVVVGVMTLFSTSMSGGPIVFVLRTYLSVFALLCWCATPIGALIMAQPSIERANRRAPRWLCWTCGYDLTGNITGTCPECGTPIHLEQCPRRIDDARFGE